VEVAQLMLQQVVAQVQVLLVQVQAVQLFVGLVVLQL
jgi:hypothetical protein